MEGPCQEAGEAQGFNCALFLLQYTKERMRLQFCEDNIYSQSGSHLVSKQMDTHLVKAPLLP